MFREEYKQANNNIKVDEALLERTLEVAFAEKPKRKTYYYRNFAPVAAALVIVIGSSVAYPKLVEKPELEKATTIATPQMTPDVNMRFDTVTESDMIATATTKPVPEVASSPQKKRSKSIARSAEEIQAEPNIDNLDINFVAIPQQVSGILPTATESGEVSLSGDFSVAEAAAVNDPAITAENAVEAEHSSVSSRMADVDGVAYGDEENTESGFAQISCKFAYGTEEYVYENELGKTFTVTVRSPESEQSEDGISIERNGKLYNLTSDNMTDSEIMEAFETLDI